MIFFFDFTCSFVLCAIRRGRIMWSLPLRLDRRVYSTTLLAWVCTSSYRIAFSMCTAGIYHVFSLYVPPYPGSLINHQPNELTNVRWDVVCAPSASSEPCPAPHLLPCLDVRNAQLHAPLPPTPASVCIIVQCHSYVSLAIPLLNHYNYFCSTIFC